MDQTREALFEPRLLKRAFACKCPRCGEGDLFQPGFLNLTLQDRCAACQLDLAKNDSGDGPAVFLIFILGSLLVPLALWVDHLFELPLPVHAVIWTTAALGVTLGLLRPIKAYVIALQLKHRPDGLS